MISPPVLSVDIPRSPGNNGALGMIPRRAETKLAAVRHKKLLPSSSAYKRMQVHEKMPSMFVVTKAAHERASSSHKEKDQPESFLQQIQPCLYH